MSEMTGGRRHEQPAAAIVIDGDDVGDRTASMRVVSHISEKTVEVSAVNTHEVAGYVEESLRQAIGVAR